METPRSAAEHKTMGERKGSKIAAHLQDYLDDVDDGWDDDFVMDSRSSEVNQESASAAVDDLLEDMAQETLAFELDPDLGLLDDADKESDATDLDEEDWDAELDIGSGAEPAAKVTLSVEALLGQPDEPTTSKTALTFVDFLKNPQPHEFTTPLLKHLPQPPVTFSTLLQNARDSPPSPVPAPPPTSPARAREPPAESNVASGFIAKMSGFAQQVEFAPFELSRSVVARVELPQLSRAISAAQSRFQASKVDECLDSMETLMNTFYQYMRSYECSTCWMVASSEDVDPETTRAELERMTDLCWQLCRHWLNALKTLKAGDAFDRAIAQCLRACHLHVRMLEVNSFLHSVNKSFTLGANIGPQLESLYLEIEGIGGFPDVLVRAKNELLAIIIADILLCRANILPLTGVTTQPITPQEQDDSDLGGGILTRINSVKSLDELDADPDSSPNRWRRRSSDGVPTGLKKPLTTCLALLQSKKLPAHVHSKLCFAISSYLSGVWATEQECVDEAEMDQLLATCQGIDEKQILEALLYESVVCLFEDEANASSVRSPTNFAHSDAVVETLPSFSTMLSYAAMRALADCWVKTKPFFALYIFPVCICMLHKQRKPVERRTLQKELAILSANHKDTERAIVHCEAVLEDARALGELSEVVFVTDLLVSQHCDRGAFEEAIRVLQETLAFLTPSDNQPHASVRRVQLQMHADSVHARLAHVYLLSGSPEIAAVEFERLFKSLQDRPESSAVLTKKVAVLSWVAKAHLKANNLEESSKALLRIKELRQRTGATAALRSAAGILNASHMWWGFRADALESCLPKYCVSSHNADLGALSARLQYRNGQYIEALKSLIPTIIAVELAVGDKTGPQDGVIELGRLYELRGKIQLAAATNSARTKFPFHLGGEQVFARMLTAYETEFSKKNAKRSSVRIGVELEPVRPDATSTCKKTRRYRRASDLLWDAMKWFKRAWECFKASGEKIRAARAASGLVKVYLQAVYVPTSLLKIQPPAGWSPPTQLSTKRATASSVDSTFNDVPTPTSPGCSHASSEAEGRRPQLQEAKAALEYLKHVLHDTFLPFDIIDMYLHMAELHWVEEDRDEAIECWKHARDAFMFLFVDGAQIPVLRVASIPWVRRIDGVLARLVRFLWTCDREFVNDNLMLLETYTLFTMDKDRAFRRAAILSRDTRRISEGKKLNPPSRAGGGGGGDGPEMPSTSPAKTGPARRRSLHQHAEPVQLPAVPYNQIPETFAAAPLEPLFHYSNAPERTEHVRISRRDGTRNFKDSDELPIKDAKSSLTNLFAPPTTPSPTAAKASTPSAASFFGSGGGSAGEPPSPKKFPRLGPTQSSGSSSGSGTTTTSASSSSSSSNRSSRMFSPIDLHAETQMALHYPWIVDHSHNARTLTGEIENTLLKNFWRCCALMDKTVQAYDTQGIKFDKFQETMKQLVRVMTVLMKRTRKLTLQYTLEDLTFDKVLESASQLCQSVDVDTTTLYERLQRLVYVVQVDELLLFYHPHSGRRHIEQLAQATDQESLVRTFLERDSSTNELIHREDSNEGNDSRPPPGHAKNISVLSAATTTTQGDVAAQPPARALLPADVCQLLVDYAIVINENACGGGTQERQLKLLRTESETFKLLGRFLRASAMVDDKELRTEETDRRSTDQSKSKRRMSSSGMTGSRIRTHLRAWFQGKQTEKSAPMIPSPMTLICSKNAHALPWEALFPEVVIVRSLCLLSMHAGAATGVCGPSKHTHPEYFGICQGISHLPGRVQQELRVRDLHRRIWGSLRVLRGLKHPMESIVHANAAVLQTPLPRLQLGSNSELAAAHQAIADQCDDRQWPIASPFLPFGKNTPQSTRSTRLKRVHYFDIVKGVNTSPTSLVGWLDNYIVPNKSFPLLFLTYSDLNELSDAVLYLLATRKDTVVVFIPHYCAALVAKEITSAVDRWCLEQASPQVGKHQSAVQSSTISEASTDLDYDVPRISESSPSVHHRHVFSAQDTRSDHSGTGRSRIYDAVMDTVIRFIEQQAAPIVVFNL